MINNIKFKIKFKFKNIIKNSFNINKISFNFKIKFNFNIPSKLKSIISTLSILISNSNSLSISLQIILNNFPTNQIILSKSSFIQLSSSSSSSPIIQPSKSNEIKLNIISNQNLNQQNQFEISTNNGKTVGFIQINSNTISSSSNSLLIISQPENYVYSLNKSNNIKS